MRAFADDGGMGGGRGMNPWLAAGGGAAAGAGATLAAQEVKKAKTRGTWGLAIGLGMLGLALVNSGNLNTVATQAQSLAQSANGLAFTANGATGLEVAALRSIVVQTLNLTAQTAFYANMFNWFNTAPVSQPAPVQVAAVSSSTVVSSNSNSNLGVLLLIGVGVVAVVMS